VLAALAGRSIRPDTPHSEPHNTRRAAWCTPCANHLSAVNQKSELVGFCQERRFAVEILKRNLIGLLRVNELKEMDAEPKMTRHSVRVCVRLRSFDQE
jgi:hypothetical protein